MKAEENTRKLERVSLDSSLGCNARTYPINIEKADTVAAALQYHRVWSLSLYRSITVRRGLHLGSDGCPMLKALPEQKAMPF